MSLKSGIFDDLSARTKEELCHKNKDDLRTVMAYANKYGDHQRDSLLALKVYAERFCYDVEPLLVIYYKRELVDRVVAAIDDHGNIITRASGDAIRELSERVCLEDWFLKNREWYLNWCKDAGREP